MTDGVYFPLPGPGTAALIVAAVAIYGAVQRIGKSPVFGWILFSAAFFFGAAALVIEYADRIIKVGSEVDARGRECHLSPLLILAVAMFTIAILFGIKAIVSLY